ncbi:Lysophospholipase 3 [Yarrowia sp. C11]|nr:Lysophospholipase 3 [Yarrowia sp. E02]KAG5369312.1 Lysophospholipase 3 [Yarrowia sp. C11]
MKISATLVAALATSVVANYAPIEVECPSDVNLSRPADGLSEQEADYINERHKKTTEALKTYLGNLDIKARGDSNFDTDSFLNESSPKLAIAAAGGGFRAMLVGAGVLAALDNRVDEDNKIGGFLQSADYLAGLSGGAWLVGSLVLNDWPTVPEIQADPNVWYLNKSMVGSADPGSMNTIGLMAKVLADTTSKLAAGYQTSLTDQWGRLVAYQTINSSHTEGGLDATEVTWSGIRNISSFVSHEIPFPIILGTSLFPGTSHDVDQIRFNNSIIEMTPYEWGTWDRTIRRFVDTEYLGTEMSDGKPTGNCTRRYDNAGFLMGTSSSIFNMDMATFGFGGFENILLNNLFSVLDIVNEGTFNVAVFNPNPFYEQEGVQSNQTISKALYVCDGGFDKEAIPILPFLQPEREVDVVLAIDPSTDTKDKWPDGQSLRITQDKSDWEFGKDIFPRIPSNDTFLKQKLNAKPVFFGCNTTSLKTYNDTDRYSPVIVYIPMSDITFESNFSTGKLSYTNEEQEGMITNGFNMMTRSNGTEDSNWDKCLGCVTLLREFQRRDSDVPNDCEQCFSDYCFN